MAKKAKKRIRREYTKAEEKDAGTLKGENASQENCQTH